jgi:CheY-like chemotaxis protein
MKNGDKKILIIEDDEAMRSLLKDVLDAEGLVTEAVSNGSDALKKLMDQAFDLIITDIQMPGLTGLDILPGIKKLQPEAPVIVITAFGSEEVLRRSFEKGATGYLEKPIHTHKLRALIHEMISSREKMITGQRSSEF